MKKLILIVLLFFVQNILLAQESPLNLILNPKVLGLIKSPNITIDTIIDARFNKEYFGTMPNLLTPISIANGTFGLKKYLALSIAKKDNSTHVTIVLKNLWITYQTIGFKKKVTCELELSICKKDENGQLRIIHKYDKKIKNKIKAIDSYTEEIPKYVKSNFENSFLTIDETKLLGNDGEMYQEESTLLRCIISNKDSLKNRFFENYSQFYLNKGLDIGSKIKMENTSETECNLYNEKTGELLNGYFGFVDDHSIYLNSAIYGKEGTSYYGKSVTFGRYLLFNNFSQSPNYGGSLTGVALTVVYYATTTNGMVFDVITGQVIPFSRKKINEILSAYPDLFAKYEIKNNKSDTFEDRKAIFDALNKAQLYEQLAK